MSQKITQTNPTVFCHPAGFDANLVPTTRRHSISATSSTHIPIAEKVKNIIDGESASAMPRYRSMTTCMAPEHRNAKNVLTALSTYVPLFRQRTSLASKLLMDESGHRVS